MKPRVVLCRMSMNTFQYDSMGPTIIDVYRYMSLVDECGLKWFQEIDGSDMVMWTEFETDADEFRSN